MDFILGYKTDDMDIRLRTDKDLLNAMLTFSKRFAKGGRVGFRKGGRRDVEGSGYYDAPQGRQEMQAMQENINRAEREGTGIFASSNGYNWGAKGKDPAVISSKDIEFINQIDGKSKQWNWHRASIMNKKTRDMINYLALAKDGKTTMRHTYPSGLQYTQEGGDKDPVFTRNYLAGSATWGINPPWTGEGPDIRKYPYAKGGIVNLL